MSKRTKKPVMFEPMDPSEKQKEQRKLSSVHSASGSHVSVAGTAIEKITKQTVGSMVSIKKQLDQALEELNSSQRIIDIPVDKIRFSSFANRSVEEITDDPTFKDLVDSIADGQVVPGLVRPVKDEPGFYEIVYGHRRFTACKQIGQNYRAEVRDLTDSEMAFLMSKENALRKDVSVYSLYHFWSDWFEKGWVKDVPHLVEKSGYSKTYVYEVLVIGKIPVEIVNKIKDVRQVSKRTWMKIYSDLRKYNDVDKEKIVKKISSLPEEITASTVLSIILNHKDKTDIKLITKKSFTCRVTRNNVSISFKDPEVKKKVLEFLQSSQFDD